MKNSYLSSISFVEQLVKLTYLDVSDNNISSIIPLAKLTRLKNLDLSNNRLETVSQIKVLKNMKLLESVNILGNDIAYSDEICDVLSLCVSTHM